MSLHFLSTSNRYLISLFKILKMLKIILVLSYISKNCLPDKWRDHFKHKLQFRANTPTTSKCENLWTTKLSSTESYYMYTYSKSLHCGIGNDVPLVNSCPFDMLQDGQANRPRKQIHTQFLQNAALFSL